MIVAFDENAFETSCDNIDGSEYVPSEDNDGTCSDEEASVSQNQTQTIYKRKSHNSSLEVSLSVNVPGKSTRDDSLMFVTAASGKMASDRRSYCMFCKTMHTKFVRHLENKHRDIEEVNKFADLPKKNPERLEIIDAIRKNCMFDFNTNKSVNLDGELLVCRRPSSYAPLMAKDYKVCQKCKGFFSKNNIRHHAKKCFGYNGSKSRTLLQCGRKILGRIHADACKLLREVIFPVMREDEVVRLIRYDTLIILYGNKLCSLHTQQHQHDLVRTLLRLLGRFLSAIRRINNEVSDLASVYHPKFYNDTISAIKNIAAFDPETGSYGAPSTAYSIRALLKKIAAFYITECVKKHDVDNKLKTEDFQKLLYDIAGVSQ